MQNNVSILLISILLISGCSLTPNLEMKSPELPTELIKSETNSSIDASWWNAYNDSLLNALIEEAIENNDDYKIAVSKLSEAEALLGLNESERYPSVSGGTSINRQKTSQEANQIAGQNIYDTYQVSASVKYEMDLWGKLKGLRDAAYSQYHATAADRDTVRLSLIANVAETYINLVAINQHLFLLEEKIKLYQDEFSYRRQQYRFGAIDFMTLEQARVQVIETKLLLEQYKESKELSENALALLIGRTPKSMIDKGFIVKKDFPKPLNIPTFLPSEILQQRPDIRSAEEHLRAINFNIGVARAAYFPSISLTGNIGVESSQLGNLFQNSANFWGIGPSVSVPIFDFGRIDKQIKNVEAQKETSEIVYAKTVKNAFNEIYDSLKKIEATQKKFDFQEEVLIANRKVAEFSNIRYSEGYVDYLNVIDAKNKLLSAEQNKIDLQAKMIINQITLYKALGGGWK
ncbi:efflux transporter outer membrane subunit [Sulfuricurvum sp.]|uniref:efflux transporter outer membrane subunit n=1 Tax=Sulfuricurvum sp. TaxID=2025608 RepID=UPI00262E5F83|nr:efflux transporter outer membrane subunit [Sulfuricurvum sp.]MDD3596274.1 efflux transporter outer membrane subunit [Sulfuricurvum sp.]